LPDIYCKIFERIVVMDESNIDSLILNPFKDNNFLLSEFKKKISIKYLSNKYNSKDKYEVVIMAAGKGTRMDLSYPKPLFEIDYPNGKKSIIVNLLHTIKEAIPNISSIQIVINSLDIDFFQDIKDLDSKITFVQLESSQINGTARCLDIVKDYLLLEKNVMLFWGDLGMIPASHIFLSAILHEKFNPLITMPTRFKKDPYVGLIRNNKGKYIEIFHSNEENQYLGWAEQDSLFFILNKNIFSLLSDYLTKKEIIQKREVDFINCIPWFNRYNNIIGIPISDGMNVSGINNMEKAHVVNKYLHKFSKEKYHNYFLNRSKI